MSRAEEARELHEQGYTTRGVHVRWVVEAFNRIDELLTIEPTAATAWREVEENARVIKDLAAVIAGSLENEQH
jgi:hypothetical protein